MQRSSDKARALLALLALGALALVVCGCGDSSGDSSSTEAGGATGGSTSSTKVLSKDELISQACAITLDTATKAAGIPVPANASDLDQLRVFIPKLARTQGSGIDQLSALIPPDEIKADWSRLVGLLKDNQKQLEVIQQKVAEKDPEGVKMLRKINSNQDAIDKLAGKIGLGNCASR